MKAAENHALRNWLLEAHAHSTWTTSVCTGVFLLGVAGIVAGLNVTTHWGSRNAVASYCQATYLAERFVVQGKIITAAGVSAGIDMALYVAQQLSDIDTAQAIQLACEYDPQPPFQSGNFQTTDERLHHAANQVIQLHRINPVSQTDSSSE
jgi:transcriptional regulator GlxA family with amidase domain